MRSIIGKSIAGVVLASTVALSAAPADAQRYRRHHGDDAAVAIGAGILGLGVGAAIASSSRNRGYYGNNYYDDRYYGNGYNDGGYYNSGYYDRGYYGGSYGRGYDGYAYNRPCTTRRVWDGYYRRWVRARYC
ncbi:MAG: hypothetical protein JWO25_1740 [Alphaproteobacteria bacterium]|nr:hypothetical protein [Alphaproteobacteria bacterium]MDB5719776.1 hypothetical protein [Alphaproteobacteria bacterium]